MKTIGPRSPTERLVKLDYRTELGRSVKKLHAELTEHCGGAPSATQRAINEAAAMLHMRMEMLNSKTVDQGLGAGDGDDRRFLAYSNSFSRLMKQLGQKSAPRPTVSLGRIGPG
jgi:hypothetical protein